MASDEWPPDDGGKAPDYEVGYGKPPKHSQFKKKNKHGKGRPRGSQNLKTYVQKALDAKVSVKLNGKAQNVSKLELGLHQLANKASGGDLKAINAAIALSERYRPIEPDGIISEEETAYDLATLRHFLWIQGEIDNA